MAWEEGLYDDDIEETKTVLEASLKKQIYKLYEKENKETARVSNGLGCAEVGQACNRRCWFSFHWLRKEPIEGRILRLFDTGKMEEERVIQELKKLGANFLHATDEQWRVEKFGGYLSGYLDGLMMFRGQLYVLEIKTHNKNSFEKLQKQGLMSAKPEHFMQLLLYVGLTNEESKFSQQASGLYVAVNKDNDEIYVEEVDFDEDLYERGIEKASDIIFSLRPPEKISDKPDSYHCKFCPFNNSCHFSENLTPQPKHCRSCAFFQMNRYNEEVSAYCLFHMKGLSLDEQKQGCDSHVFIPELVGFEYSSKVASGVVYYDLCGVRYINKQGSGELVKYAESECDI